MAGSYSAEQQIHCISSLTNASFGVTFSSFSALQAFTTKVISDVLANATIQGYIGSDWTPVWGPVTVSENPNAKSVVADNTMILLYSPSQNLFVLGIAGTNIDSTYDWMSEDFSVNTRVLWTDVMGSEFKMPGNAYPKAAIGGGANNGLTILLGMTDSNGKTMIQALSAYLANLSQPAQLAVAGHSLGGALAPVMGLYLHDSQQFSGNWNSSGKISTIAIHATAGPTPGEQNFAKYIPYVIAHPVSGQATLTYESLYNTLDVVPQAWQASTLGSLPTLYEANIQQPSGSTPPETMMGVLAVGAVLNSIDTTSIITELFSLFTQVQPWTSMTGTFDTTTDDAITKKLKYIAAVLPTSLTSNKYDIYFVNFARYLAQAAFQHTTAYDTLLNIAGFADEYATIKKGETPGNLSMQQLNEQAVGRILGVDLSRLSFDQQPNVTSVEEQATV